MAEENPVDIAFFPFIHKTPKIIGKIYDFTLPGGPFKYWQLTTGVGIIFATWMCYLTFAPKGKTGAILWAAGIIAGISFPIITNMLPPIRVPLYLLIMNSIRIYRFKEKYSLAKHYSFIPPEIIETLNSTPTHIGGTITCYPIPTNSVKE